MSLLGNTIARALALVSVGTAAAFVHWGMEPLRLTIAAPAGSTGAQSPAPTTDSQQPTTDQADPTGAGQADNTQQPTTDTPEANDPDPAPTESAPFDPFSLGTEINTEQAYQLWASGTVAFIDARPADQYQAGHIPFAYMIPPDSLGSGRLGDMQEIGGVFPDMRVVVYCEGGTCDASHLVALRLQEMGFDKIHIDTDGFPAWQAAGHQVETGPDAVLGDLP